MVGKNVKLKEKRKNVPIRVRYSLSKLKKLEKRIKKYTKRRRGITINKRYLYFKFKTLKGLPKTLTYCDKFIFCYGALYLTIPKKILLNFYKKYIKIVNIKSNSIIVECPEYDYHPYLRPAVICGALGGGTIRYKNDKRYLEIELKDRKVLKELGVT